MSQRAWCQTCGKYYQINDDKTWLSAKSSDTIKGVSFDYNFYYVFCPACGDEIITNDMADASTHEAHVAYKHAAGE